MRHYAFLLAFMLASFAYMSHSYAALSCSISAAPPAAGEITVLKLFSTTNTHASLPTDTSAQYYLNCKDTLGIQLYNTASGNFIPLLRLTSSTNAHVQQPSVGTYPSVAYIGTAAGFIECAYASSCVGYDTCLASMSGISNANLGSCGSFPTNICCKLSDTTAPTVYAGYSPAEIGAQTIVAYTATATDSSGISSVRLFVDNIMKKECASSPCTYSEGLYSEGTAHSVFATAKDTFGNTGTSAEKAFTVCKLDSASVQLPGSVKPGDKVNINVAYHGACPSTAFIQVDALGSDCRIAATGADITGIQGACASSPCTAQWTVPTVPLKCQAKTIQAKLAALYKSSFPPTGERFSGSTAGGSFSFYFDPANTMTTTLALSKTLPNSGETITGALSCYVSDADEQVQCDNSNAKVNSIFIDSTDYIAAENWNQNLYYNSTAKAWDIPVDTNKYSSVLTAAVTYNPSNISGGAAQSYTVNLPPEISNVTMSPSVVTVGQLVTFSASITDPDAGVSGGIHTAKACGTIVPTDCGVQYCKMSSAGGSIYKCTYNTSSLPEGTFTFFVFANDTLGAWNFTAYNQSLSITFDKLDISLEFPDVRARLVPTTSPQPNFTKSMNITFLVQAQLTDLSTGTKKKCTPGICNAFYSVDLPPEGPWTPLQWDAFSAAWRASPPSADLTCDVYHNLSVRAESISPAGLADIKTYQFFVNCVPKVSVAPVERRLVLGDSAVTVFNVTLWNPLDETIFTLKMLSQNADGTPLQWVSLVCGQNCTPGFSDDQVVLEVAKVGSNSVQVFMQTAAKSGVYPITFAASSGGGDYKSTGTIQVFAEGLADYTTWQLFTLLIAGVAAWFLIKGRKGAAGKQARKRPPRRKRRRR